MERKNPGIAWELYDMETDRTEQCNLAEQYPEVMHTMIQKYEAWEDRVGVVRWQDRR